MTPTLNKQTNKPCSLEKNRLGTRLKGTLTDTVRQVTALSRAYISAERCLRFSSLPMLLVRSQLITLPIRSAVTPCQGTQVAYDVMVFRRNKPSCYKLGLLFFYSWLAFLCDLI